jgi:hypothetical protein
MINPAKEEEEVKNDNKENPERTRPSTTKHSSTIGDSGATPNMMRTLDSEHTGALIKENKGSNS